MIQCKPTVFAALFLPAAILAAEVAPPAPDNTAVQTMNRKYVAVWRALMDPKRVSDEFGRRVGKGYIAIQVTVANRHDEYQWLIQEASIDLGKIIGAMQRKESECPENLQLLSERIGDLKQLAYVSSADLSVLRGVSEKGQLFDRRNVVLRLLQGSGAIAASLTGVATFGPAYAPAMAWFNGPVISAFHSTIPDYTVNELNRINDRSFVANTVVGKQESKVFVVFLPQSYLLTKQQQAQYWKDPESVYGCVDLRLLTANIDGNFVQAVNGAPTATSVAIEPSEAAKFAQGETEIHGVVVGRLLREAGIEMVAALEGLSVEKRGDAEESRLPFLFKLARPIAPDTPIALRITGPGGVRTEVTYIVAYQAARPELIASDSPPLKGRAGEKLTVKLSGRHFLPNATTVEIRDAEITTGDLIVRSGTELELSVAISAKCQPGAKDVFVHTRAGGRSDPIAFTVLAVEE